MTSPWLAIPRGPSRLIVGSGCWSRRSLVPVVVGIVGTSARPATNSIEPLNVYGYVNLRPHVASSPCCRWCTSEVKQERTIQTLLRNPYGVSISRCDRHIRSGKSESSLIIVRIHRVAGDHDYARGGQKTNTPKVLLHPTDSPCPQFWRASARTVHGAVRQLLWFDGRKGFFSEACCLSTPMIMEDRRGKAALLTFRSRGRYFPALLSVGGSMHSVLWVRRCLWGSPGTSGPVEAPGDPPWFGRFGSTGHANRRHSIILAPNSLIKFRTKERRKVRSGDTLLAVSLGAVKK